MPAPPPTHVRSYSKVNLGLAIGPPRADGFHSLVTLYQTLALHDVVSVVARAARQTRITLRSNDRRVPLDTRNTVWKMTERVLAQLHRTAEVTVHIQKNLPIQGGMGAGSGNAAAALEGLERQLGVRLADDDRLRLAAEVGSDVPLFLVGGSVFGTDRGQQVHPAPAVTLGGSDEIPCVVALPGVGVSTPQAFRDWDGLLATDSASDLHSEPIRGSMEKLSQTYASVFPAAWPRAQAAEATHDTFGAGSVPQHNSANLRSAPPEQLQTHQNDAEGTRNNAAGNTLQALAAAGIRNDFQTVVFPQHPELGRILRLLEGEPERAGSAVYAALSGSGSAVFGLFHSEADAGLAQQRLQHSGVEALVTKTLPRRLLQAHVAQGSQSGPFPFQVS